MDNNSYELLKQEFDNLKSQVIELKADNKLLHDKFNNLDKANTRIDVQYVNIMQSLKTLTETTIPNLTKEVEDLKNKPAKRYETIVSSILGAIFGAIGGAIIGIILK